MRTGRVPACPRALRIVTLLAAVLSVSAAQAETIVCGDVSGTWTPSGNPYIVSCNVAVSGSLRIEPGVVVKFNPSSLSLTVGEAAKLAARGTAEEPIVFEPYIGTNPGSWDRISIVNSGNDDTLAYCIIRYGTTGIDVSNSAPCIADCEIFGHNVNGIYANDSDVSVTGCDVHHNVEHGVYLRSDTEGRFGSVSWSLLHDNGITGFTFYGYGINNSITTTCDLDHSAIYGNLQFGVFSQSETYWNWDYVHALPRISNCTIVENLNGVGSSNNRGDADAGIVNSIVAFNTEHGVYNTGEIDPSRITNNCFWENGSGDFAGLTLPPGFGSNGDYRNYIQEFG